MLDIKRHIKQPVMLLLSLCTILLCSISAWGTQYDLKDVRVGLFYSSTSVSSFSIKSQEGINIGFSSDSGFKSLFKSPSSSDFTVRKDSYLNNDAAILSVYGFENQSSGSGYYHIQIGSTFDTLDDVNSKISLYSSKGVSAFAAYQDSWRIFTGFYQSATSAQTALDKLKTQLGDLSYTIISPSSSRVMISSNIYSTSSTTYSTYTVQSGDYLSKIGKQFGLSVSELKSINGLTSDLIKVGQVLKVKSGAVVGSSICLMFDSASHYIEIDPTKNSSPLCVNNQSYRGNIEVRRISGSDMTIINLVPIEAYLYSVVAAEIGGSTNIEALKAQSIAARTYVIKNLKKHSNSGFNVCATEHCQAYKGTSLETSNTINAVDATQGKILTYNGEAAEVLYSSSNGGSTDDAKYVWRFSLPYIKSFADKYDPAESWEINLTPDSIKKLTGGKIGNILDVKITKTNENNRVIGLKISGDKGSLDYTNEECRTSLGLPSQLFTIKKDGSASSVSGSASISIAAKDGIKKLNTDSSSLKIVGATRTSNLNIANSSLTVMGLNGVKSIFKLSEDQPSGTPSNAYKFCGLGRGHALGMSQKGAIKMGNSGLTYLDILNYYYPGCNIE